ncbi:double zinc ribbon domain-containing protein [Geopsychrobacter electrodiphilus]|uniref:double zinc ribbon domain-containing protein n=1 Tax=Geopsychrobacter electrodiphilus TaxID=225196 RepID=UPI0003781CE3|nr:zinc ribbon domain-containing protein [Geopsychrobacter electrodiphilus]
MYWDGSCANGATWFSYWWLPGFGLVLLLLALVVIGLLVRQLRRPRVVDATCPKCSGAVRSVYFRCPHCGETLKNNCPACSRVVESGWVCCPHCTAALAK